MKTPQHSSTNQAFLTLLQGVMTALSKPFQKTEMRTPLSSVLDVSRGLLTDLTRTLLERRVTA